MFGKKARQIREQEEKIAALTAALEAKTSENAALLERVRQFEERERSISRALTEATTQAERVMSDAQRQAGDILKQSQSDSEAARREAERIVDDAYDNAHDILKDAETESIRRMDETQEQIETYAAILKSYDKLVQDNIRSAEENARLFAKMGQRLRAAIPQILSKDGKLIETKPEEPQELPVWEDEIQLPTRGDAPETDEMPTWDALDDDDEPETASGKERLWTVSELSRVDVRDASVDAIIDGVIDGASRK